MTISSSYTPTNLAGTGSLDTFGISFNFLSISTNIKVSIKVDSTGVITEKTAGVHYNVSGSNVVFTASNFPASGETVIIELNPDYKQETDYVESDSFPAESHEAALDKLTLEAQLNKDLITRSIKVDSAVDTSTFDATLPTPAADKYVKFNSTATGLEAFTLNTTSGLGNVADDTSPQLGADLDTNGNDIDFAAGDVISMVDGSNSQLLRKAATGNDLELHTPWYNLVTATGDGTTIDTTALNADLTAATGGTLVLPEGDYKVDGNITVPANTTLMGYGARIFNTTDNDAVLILNSGCKVIGLEIEGPGTSSTVNANRGISIVGTNNSPSAPTNLTDILVKDCYIHSFKGDGVFIQHADTVQIINNRIEDIQYAGVGVESAINVDVSHNRIKNILGGSGNGYGIFFSRQATASLTAEPRCTNSICIGNRIEDIPVWHGIDTHAADNITIGNNITINCLRGIALSPSSVSSVPTFAPINNTITGNYCEGASTPGGGIIITGAGTGIGSVTEYAENNTITGNIVKGHGSANSNTLGAIRLETTASTIVSSNVIQDALSSGINFTRNNDNFSCTGNLIKDYHDSTLTTPSAIRISENYNTGFIGNNQFLAGSSADTYQDEYGVYFGGSNGNGNVSIGHNMDESATAKFGGSNACEGVTVVQTQVNQSTSTATTGTVIPYDNTIPQNTEGSELFTLSITPQNANNVLVIEADLSMVDVATSGDMFTAALFVDSSAGALTTAAIEIPTAGNVSQMRLIYKVSAVSIVARTYKIRFGGSTGSSAVNRRHGSGNLFGSTNVATLRITEYEEH